MAKKRNYQKSGVREKATRQIDRQRHPIEKISYIEYNKLNSEQMYNLLRRASTLAQRRQSNMLKRLQFNPQTGEFENKSIPIPQSYRRTNRNGQGWATFDFRIGSNWREFRYDINKARERFRVVQSFLQNESSTWEGWMDIIKRTSERIGKEFIPNATDQEKYSFFWEIYNAVSEVFTREVLEGLSIYGKALQEYIAEVQNSPDYVDMTPTEIASMIINDIDAIEGNGMQGGFEELNKRLNNEYQDYLNSNPNTEITFNEFKRRVISNEIETSDDIYYSSRGF